MNPSAEPLNAHHSRALPVVPQDEADRLVALRGLAILDTPRTDRFDRLTRLLARALAAPAALVSFVDDSRQWVKSCFGIEVAAMPLQGSFCAHAVINRELLLVPDAASDMRFATSPLVLGPHRFRAYGGAPLFTLDGYAVGTLCVLDVRPRAFTLEQQQILCDLANLAEDLLHARPANAQGV